MKAYGVSDKFYKGGGSKTDNVKGPVKKRGLQNWWEEAAEGVVKKSARQKAKIQIRKDVSES